MEVKNWSYEEFPEFTQPVEGAHVVDTTGEELGASYTHDVEYACVDGIPLRLQILVPNRRNRPFMPFAEEQSFALPCFVYVQGSAWREQYLYGNLCQLGKLCVRGYVCAIVEYRHSGLAAFPAQAVDARNAVRFLKANAKKYGIDPSRMVLAGDSSGGHTSIWAGLLQDDDGPENLFPGVSAQVRGLISYYGAVSAMAEDSFPTTVNHHLPDSPEGQLMGGADMRQNPELRQALSAECHIGPDAPNVPVLLFHGTKDRIVNTAGSVRLYEALKAAGKDASLYLLKGADHGGPEFWSDAVLDIVDPFCQRCFA